MWELTRRNCDCLDVLWELTRCYCDCLDVLWELTRCNCECLDMLNVGVKRCNCGCSEQPYLVWTIQLTIVPPRNRRPCVCDVINVHCQQAGMCNLYSNFVHQIPKCLFIFRTSLVSIYACCPAFQNHLDSCWHINSK
jgi:hypothetical protein